MRMIGAMAGVSIAAALATVSIAAVAATPRVHVAACDPGPVTIGSGSPGWRRTSLSAGPVGVARNPLRYASPIGRAHPRQLVAKMPMLVEGRRDVRVRVPRALRHRAFLYYGFHRDPEGRRSTSFAGYPGDTEIEFRPCADRPRTVWPGGIRLRSRRPVRLIVEVGGRRIPLRLGRPGPRR